MKPKLLWVGDAGVPSGFARATHETLDVLKDTYDVCVLGLNYRGDPHDYPYPIYAAAPGGDAFGVGRLIWMCDLHKPDLIVLQNDPWNIPPYVRQLKRFEEYKNVPVVGAIAVDGKNCRGVQLNDLTLGIFWTQFGLDEARLGGFTGSGVVVPLGVDVTNYYKQDRVESRRKIGLPSRFDDAFIVGNVNRNQPRKRLDLTIRYFSTWVKEHAVEDAYLYLHVAPTGDFNGYDVVQLMRYYDCSDRLILIEPATFYGKSEEHMRDTYNSFNVQLSTTQGEGFGLTTFEGAACGVLQIVPDWSALGELMKDAAYLIDCPTTCATHDRINVIGGVPDERQVIEALSESYLFREELAEAIAKKGTARANESRFRWKNVGVAFRDALEVVTCPSR